MDVSKVIDKKIDYWKKKLIDLSKRNNLVRYRFTKSKSLKIISPSFSKVIEDLENEQNIFILKEKKDNAKDRQWLCSEEEETVEKKLYTLYLKAKENFQELGVSTCFVSLGILKYKDADNSDLYLEAPIFLWSLEISRLPTISKETHKFEIDSNSGEMQLNPALIEKLSHEFGIEINEFENQTPSEYLSYLKKQIEGMKDWKIIEDVYMDIFSYQKFIMYEDLSFNEKLVKDSPLVKAYVGDRDALQDEISELQREEFDDTTSVDVLPADSSQKRAIELAKAGVTFVLQGPPGTGKSQTIVNIISALIEKNKKILFVSQKMAALNVVQKRLDEVGLGRYCLNLHNYKGNKREVIKQFMKELQTSPVIPSMIKRDDVSSYLKSQKDINEFYQFLCEKHSPWELSVYDVRGELAKLSKNEIVDFPLKRSISLNKKEFSILFDKLERFNSSFTLLGNPNENIYFNYQKDKNTSLAINRFSSNLKNFDRNTEKIIGFIDKLKIETEVEINSIVELNLLNELNDKIVAFKFNHEFSYLLSKDFEEYNSLIKELLSVLLEIKEMREDITKRVKDSFIDNLNTHQVEKIFRETSFFSRLFNQEYKTNKANLDKYSKTKMGHAEWLSLFEKKAKYEKINKKLNEIVSKNKKKSEIIGDCSNLSNISRLDKYCKNLIPLFEISNKISKGKNYAIIQLLSNFNQKGLFRDFYSSLNEIEGFFEVKQLTCLEKIQDILNVLGKLNNQFKNLKDVLAFKEEYIKLNEEVKEFIKKYFGNAVRSEFSKVFLKSYYLQILDEILKKSNKFSPKSLVEKFRDDDMKVRDIFRYKVMESVEERQPKDNYSSMGSNEVSILKRENEKKRRLKPIRDLLEQIPDLAFALKPCFMMSPLTVSQYINPKNINFDVVIFDEASQIMPEDAVPCLIRAKQAIIMGDTQQLPPTSFFLSQDDESEEEIEDLESFLSESITKFRTKSLDWHYRSNNETLISFSNRFFYENRLITFPNPKENDNSGLDYVYIKTGVYDRGKSRKNRIEAREIVKIYRDLKKKYPKKSFGIIAFSMAQENAIREEFQVAGIPIEESIDVNNEEVFVKNLETVQGDERDIIILSVGYGKDSSGKFSYNFGPLNKEGGYKRLNVSITRSRFKTIVVSSMLPDDLDEDKINAEGVRYLKYYLDFAKSKDLTKFLQKTEGLQFDSSFEEAVYEELKKEGFDVSCQIGCSGYRVDLAIKHPKKPGEYILGVECDGSQYHSSRFARDRDKIRQVVLENLGWNIIRIWSDDWLNNKEYEIEKIKEKVKNILKSKGIPEPKQNNYLSKIDEKEDFKEIEVKDKYKKYKIAEISKSNMDLEFDSYGSLNNYSAVSIIKRKIMQILEIESPIEKELLYKRVLSSMGIQKLGRRIENLFEEILGELNKDKGIHIYQNTVSLEPVNIFSEVKISEESDRPFILIPKEELAGAIIDILKNSFSTTKEAITADIARGIYNNNRTGNKIRDKVEEAINHLIKNKLIDKEKDKIKLKR